MIFCRCEIQFEILKKKKKCCNCQKFICKSCCQNIPWPKKDPLKRFLTCDSCCPIIIKTNEKNTPASINQLLHSHKHLEEVTKKMKETIQKIVDETCEPQHRFSFGKDVKPEENRPYYNRLLVKRVFKIKNSNLRQLYNTKKDIIKKSPKPETVIKSKVSSPNLPPVNDSINEVFLFSGTKPKFVGNILENGFDLRKASEKGKNKKFSFLLLNKILDF